MPQRSVPDLVLPAIPGVRPEVWVWFHAQLLTADEFAALAGPAMALEAVAAPPVWLGDRWNLDHHKGVARLFHDCVAKQVLVGTDNNFWALLVTADGETPLNVHITRLDEDVALAFALVADPSLAASPRIRQLVEREDELDRSGGAACHGATRTDLGEIAAVFEPCQRARAEGRRTDGAVGAAVLAAVCERVHAYARCELDSLAVEGRFEILERRGPVAVVAEYGPYARLGLRPAGIEAYVAERREGANRIVTIGLTGAFVPLDLPAVYDELNRLEPVATADRWGGSTHIGGSPFAGTAIPASQILAIMHKHYRGPRLSARISAARGRTCPARPDSR